MVDVRYDGRIAHTQEVAVVPAFGNHTFLMPFKPLFGREMMEVFLVSGAGGPGRISHIHLQVNDRPLLQVTDVGLAKGSVDEGDDVTVVVVVRNGGNATSTGHVVELLVDGTLVANESLFLGPGEMANVTFVWRSKGPGVHAISARIPGDELGASSASLDVNKVETPALRIPAVILTIGMMACLKLVVRRSLRARRA
jgi:hypothetical protein